jgi:hypothetical protein
MTQTQQPTQSSPPPQTNASASVNAEPSPQTARLTPISNTAPAPAIATNELSGTQWVGRFPTSASTSDLEPPFRDSIDSFVAALRVANAAVTISATLRPPERAYLMHWCWKISKQNFDPLKVPARSGVSIDWVHKDAAGAYSATASKAAATSMVHGYGMQTLGVAPALASRHIEGHAIDMSILWKGALSAANASGTVTSISTTPCTGMNIKLHEIGATYGVIKYKGSGNDAPHWSTDGH